MDYLINNTRPNAPLLVIDLEATCSDDGLITPETMETIEIGACWIGVDGTVIDKFQFSWGVYDRKQFERDSVRHGVVNPVALSHLNAKRMFAKAQKIGKEVGMAKACQLTGLQLEGSHHRALDDATNITRLLPWSFGEQALPKRDAPASSV
ncbi:3'-5' exonuclease [Undibacterium curvum]|uniref:Exonuclease domain-containing protein n=1 Tax=Undibacterium curvum TaxID=2762294 RepID=A0ABR7A6U5_9BURK|nr:3'-5' exonuclease [Undibacterium curvum]MBC3932605.1 exonuclease domain-containing protein [Undibacterium curvum]